MILNLFLGISGPVSKYGQMVSMVDVSIMFDVT